MPTSAITELVCLFFVIIVTYGLWQQHDHRKSTYYLLVSLLCNMVTLSLEIVSQCFYGNSFSSGTMNTYLVISLLFGNITFIPFIHYCKAYMEEKMTIGKWLFRIPVLCSVMIILLLLSGVILLGTQDVPMVMAPTEEFHPTYIILPLLFCVLVFFVLFYLPIIAFRRRKYIGWKPVILMSIFGFFPVIAGTLFQDYIAVSVSMALVIIAVIMQNTIAFEREENQRILREKTDELLALNNELETARAMAEAASEFKTNFLNNMSHDIRTPMNAILGFSRLMEKSVDNPVVIADYLSKINRSGEYLLSIINNILEVARIDSGSETLDENIVDLNCTRGSIAPIFEGEVKRKGITFSVSLTNLEHPYVYADIPKLNEIGMNLVGNAMKYTPEGGSVSIRVGEIPCEREGYASFELIVYDTGIGMSEEFLEHIFDSFSRERNTTESKVIGTGLGMSIVKKLVDMMDGTIDIKSKQGEGTTIRVTTTHRIVDNPEAYFARQHQEEDVDVDLTGKRILLAEDNELNAEIAIEVLGEFGILVDHAENGIECINMLKNAQDNYYDMILMDIQMPNMNGYDATRHIRSLSNETKANIPIIAMTANAFEEDRKKALEAGMDGHLAKPVDLKKLTRTLKEMM